LVVFCVGEMGEGKVFIFRPCSGCSNAMATLRVTFWGALAMALTAGIGALVGTAL